MSSSPPPEKINVRNIISLFENQTVTSVKSEPSVLLKRTKSMGHLSRKPIYKSTEKITVRNEINELTQIEDRIDQLEISLTNYQVYSKESHVYFQNVIFSLLIDIVNVQTDDIKTNNRKNELIELMKRLNKELNLKLPANKNNIISNGISSLRITTEQPKDQKETVDEKDGTDTPLTPSVKKLKFLFENKQQENKGLNEFVPEKAPKRFLSFNGSTCGFKYVRYNEKVDTNDTKYVVDENYLAKQRVVHNTTLQRNTQEVKVKKLEKIQDGGDSQQVSTDTNQVTIESSQISGEVTNAQETNDEYNENSRVRVEDLKMIFESNKPKTTVVVTKRVIVDKDSGEPQLKTLEESPESLESPENFETTRTLESSVNVETEDPADIRRLSRESVLSDLSNKDSWVSETSSRSEVEGISHV